VSLDYKKLALQKTILIEFRACACYHDKIMVNSMTILECKINNNNANNNIFKIKIKDGIFLGKDAIF